jgi:hypothetical protein
MSEQHKPDTDSVIEVKFAYFIQNGGDGSAHPVFFKDEAEAERYRELRDEMCRENFCECTGETTLRFSAKTGELLNPDVDVDDERAIWEEEKQL